MIRDSKTKALLAADISELNKYRVEKRREKDINTIKHEIYSLKMLINNLIEKVERIENSNE
jgi:hypothetical protein